MMELHLTRSGLRSEHFLKAEPDFAKGTAVDNMGQYGFRERGNKGTRSEEHTSELQSRP